jgi:hypothetical protein
MGDLHKLIWCFAIGLFRSRAALEAEIVALRHQLKVRAFARPITLGFQKTWSRLAIIKYRCPSCGNAYFFGATPGFSPARVHESQGVRLSALPKSIDRAAEQERRFGFLFSASQSLSFQGLLRGRVGDNSTVEPRILTPLIVVRISVSGVYFPRGRKSPAPPRVRLVGGGLWPAISGISVLWAGAGNTRPDPYIC